MVQLNSLGSSKRLLLATVFISLAGSRWATYVGISPFFISDALIFCCLAAVLFAKKTKNEIHQPRQRDLVLVLVVIFFAASIVRFVFSLAEGYSLLDTLRDFVPFFYIAVTLLTYWATKSVNLTVREKFYRTLKVALYIHLFWCFAVSILNLREGVAVLPVIFGAPLFSFRPDIDTALVAILFIVILRDFANSKFSIARVATLACCSFVLLTSPARSSLIGLFFGMIWLLYSLVKSGKRIDENQSKSNRVLVVALSLISPFMLLAGTSGERLLATLGLGQSQASVASSALGTQQARQLVWAQVLDWVNASDSRALFGSGFGINFLDVTQTLALLEGTTYTGVRSPHNFFITVLARLGWPVAIFFMVTVCLVVWLTYRTIKEDNLSFLAMTVVLVLIPVSFLGVVLEAPFGAIPFYFALGILLRRRIEIRDRNIIGG